MANCCGDNLRETTPQAPAGRWRLVLWVALAINLLMFAVEGASGWLSGSASLQADSLDFLGDAANYGISLGVVGLALVWRARAAMLKGATMLLFGLWVAGITLWGVWHGETPNAPVMGTIGLMALIANLLTAVMLFGFRRGDANMRSVWICSRNDAIGNLAVMLAALGVFGTGTRWPDLLVAAIMAGLALQGGWQVVRQAAQELKSGRITPSKPYRVEIRRP
jgi:Co/Zn/Cd efflux system component